jgi:hypothetical protein
VGIRTSFAATAIGKSACTDARLGGATFGVPCVVLATVVRDVIRSGITAGERIAMARGGIIL